VGHRLCFLLIVILLTFAIVATAVAVVASHAPAMRTVANGT
jgi:hypothetical protein